MLTNYFIITRLRIERNWNRKTLHWIRESDGRSDRKGEGTRAYVLDWANSVDMSPNWVACWAFNWTTKSKVSPSKTGRKTRLYVWAGLTHNQSKTWVAFAFVGFLIGPRRVRKAHPRAGRGFELGQLSDLSQGKISQGRD